MCSVKDLQTVIVEIDKKNLGVIEKKSLIDKYYAKICKTSNITTNITLQKFNADNKLISATIQVFEPNISNINVLIWQQIIHTGIFNPSKTPFNLPNIDEFAPTRALSFTKILNNFENLIMFSGAILVFNIFLTLFSKIRKL